MQILTIFYILSCVIAYRGINLLMSIQCTHSWWDVSITHLSLQCCCKNLFFDDPPLSCSSVRRKAGLLLDASPLQSWQNKSRESYQIVHYSKPSAACPYPSIISFVLYLQSYHGIDCWLNVPIFSFLIKEKTEKNKWINNSFIKGFSKNMKIVIILRILLGGWGSPRYTDILRALAWVSISCDGSGSPL